MAHPRMEEAYVRELLTVASGDEVRVEGHAYVLPLKARPVVEVVPAGGKALRVQVADPIANEVAAGPEVFGPLTRSTRLPYGLVFFAGDRVWAEGTVRGESVDGVLLDNAMHSCVGWWPRTGRHSPRPAEAGPAVLATGRVARRPRTVLRGLPVVRIPGPRVGIRLRPCRTPPPVAPPSPTRLERSTPPATCRHRQ